MSLMLINKRNELLDILKGFAIILVVLGHSVQYLLGNNNENWLFSFIYSFHMPLFMFISGYVCYRVGGRVIDLRKRFKVLIIPFFFLVFSRCRGLTNRKSNKWVAY